MVTRHEFLDMLHYQLNPRGYLEIGVLYGDSIRLARCPAFGIDPNPMLYGHSAQTTVFQKTSDEFFADLRPEDLPVPIDLAFIDGLHLYEQALRDFRNIEKSVANVCTVVVFDDVLPRNQQEAARVQCPGDWTGDVWKVIRALEVTRPDLRMAAVDTSPTGTFVVWGLVPGEGNWSMFDRFGAGVSEQDEVVPEEIISRKGTWSPQQVLTALEEWCGSR